MTPAVLAAVALGMLLGPLLNVVIDRLPRGAALLDRRQGWPAPDRRLLLVTLTTAGLFGVMAAVFGATWVLPAYLYLAAISVPLAVIDLAVKRLPNAIVLPSYVVAGLLLLAPAAAAPDWGAYLRAWLAALVLFGLYFLLALIYPAGMGFGDVKLAGVLGLYLGWLGWGPLVVGAFLGFVFGAVVGAALLLVRKAKVKSTFPFGPFMLAGALVAVVWGQYLADLYTGAAFG